MPLPSSGPISLSQVNTELGLSSTANISMGNSNVRTLFGVASGAISMSNGYGKANQFAFTISSSQANANLRTLAVNAGWNGSSKVVATVGSGVYIYSTSTGTPGLTIDGSWPGGIELINNGYIMGMGGDGSLSTGAAGGNAISLGVSLTITNNSYIGGGGGGGGSGGNVSGPSIRATGGGGAGGGAGGSLSGGAGGAGGSIGAAGGNGGGRNLGKSGDVGAGGGGGRIMPGSGGQRGRTYSDPSYGGVAGLGGGAGGGGAGWSSAYGSAGDGGSAGSAGGSATNFYNSGGGGGWGASGGSGGGAGGGAGGKCVALNGYTVTWAATGTRYGAIS